MAWGKKKRHTVITTLVGEETRVQGDIQFVGGCHIDGYVKGNVRSLPGGDGEAILSIAEGACVEGNVHVPQVLLSGTIKGDVVASERVELAPSARVVGNVEYNLLEMAIGAEVNGKLIHQSESRSKEEPEPAVVMEPVARVKVAGE